MRAARSHTRVAWSPGTPVEYHGLPVSPGTAGPVLRVTAVPGLEARHLHVLERLHRQRQPPLLVRPRRLHQPASAPAHMPGCPSHTRRHAAYVSTPCCLSSHPPMYRPQARRLCTDLASPRLPPLTFLAASLPAACLTAACLTVRLCIDFTPACIHQRVSVDPPARPPARRPAGRPARLPACLIIIIYASTCRPAFLLPVPHASARRLRDAADRRRRGAEALPGSTLDRRGVRRARRSARSAPRGAVRGLSHRPPRSRLPSCPRRMARSARTIPQTTHPLSPPYTICNQRHTPEPRAVTPAQPRTRRQGGSGNPGPCGPAPALCPAPASPPP